MQYSQPIISFNKVGLDFDGPPILRRVSFTIEKGEFVYLVGPSGAGKSSLLKLIFMDLFPTAGEVKVLNYSSNTIKRRQIPKLRRRLGMVFQDYMLLDDRNVFENVALPLEIMGVSHREIERRVNRVLEEVGLTHRRFFSPSELSGGEQQRVSIARAVVKDPMVLLADEPTGNLDMAVSLEILELLWRVQEKGTAVIMASHDMELLKHRRARMLRLVEGEIKEGWPL